jgi:transcription elongation factor
LVKVVGKSKNSGDVIGMTKSFQKKHHVKPGDTVGVVRGGMRHLQLIVEDIDPEFEKKGEDVVTVNIDNGKERNIFLDFSSKVHENEEKKAA